MDRLILQQVDFAFQAKIIAGWRWKHLTSEQRQTARKGRTPRPADEYRGAKRNARLRSERSNPSVGRGYRGPILLNRSSKWRHADNYFDARDLSQSSRPVT